MSKDDIAPAAFSINELKEIIDSYSDVEQKELFDYLRQRELNNINTKIGNLPDFGMPQYAIFDDRTVQEVTTHVIEKRKRRYTLFCHSYSHPYQTDDQLVDFLKLIEPGRSFSSAIRDVNRVKFAIGNMPKASKQLIKWQVTEMLKRAYQKAEALDNPDAMAAAANAIGRANNVNSNDDEIPWDDMITPNFEPTNDIKALSENIKPFSDEDISKMRKKYSLVEDARIS